MNRNEFLFACGLLLVICFALTAMGITPLSLVIDSIAMAEDDFPAQAEYIATITPAPEVCADKTAIDIAGIIPGKKWEFTFTQAVADDGLRIWIGNQSRHLGIGVASVHPDSGELPQPCRKLIWDAIMRVKEEAGRREREAIVTNQF